MKSIFIGIQETDKSGVWISATAEPFWPMAQYLLQKQKIPTYFLREMISRSTNSKTEIESAQKL